jgi:hypothetical protein
LNRSFRFPARGGNVRLALFGTSHIDDDARPCSAKVCDCKLDTDRTVLENERLAFSAKGEALMAVGVARHRRVFERTSEIDASRRTFVWAGVPWSKSCRRSHCSIFFSLLGLIYPVLREAIHARDRRLQQASLGLCDAHRRWPAGAALVPEGFLAAVKFCRAWNRHDPLLLREKWEPSRSDAESSA